MTWASLYKCGASCYKCGRVGIVSGELVGASWNICGTSCCKCGPSWLGRVGINIGRVGWDELILGRIDWHPSKLVSSCHSGI